MGTTGTFGLGLTAVQAGAISAVASGGLSILAGEKPKDWLKSAAVNTMGAIGGKLQKGKFEAKAFARMQLADLSKFQLKLFRFNSYNIYATGADYLQVLLIINIS